MHWFLENVTTFYEKTESTIQHFDANEQEFVLRNADKHDDFYSTLRTLRNVRRRLRSVINIIGNDIIAAEKFHKLYGKNIEAATARFIRNLNYPTAYEIIEETLMVSSNIVKMARDLRDFLNENAEINIANSKRQSKVESIDDIYSKAKFLSDAINQEYEKLSFFTVKIGEQQKKIEGLEAKYRDSITTIAFNEDDFKNKRSFIEKTYNISKDFLENISQVDNKIAETNESYIKIKDVVDNLGEKAKAINETLESKLSDIDDIVNKANDALGSATNVMLGGHFKDQYEKSKEGAEGWLIVGGLFLIGAIIQCLFAVFYTGGVSPNSVNNAHLHYMISRLLIAPLFLIGTWFCASQYIKQKNIIEDYAYKKVLSLSLLSIKSEIEKTGAENTNRFIRAIQNEIMKSPLDSLERKHYSKEIKMLKGAHSEMLKDMLSNKKIKGKIKDKEIKKDI